MCGAIMGTGEGRPAEILGFEVSDIQFAECYIITVLWDERQLTFLGMADRRLGYKWSV
jgi:hypothetical protein